MFIFVISFMLSTSVFAECKPGDINCYNNYPTETLVSCGDGMIKEIPPLIPKVTSIVYTTFQILVPILLVVFSMFDLVKAISAQKEDDIKKGQKQLIRRVIAGVIVFFVFVIVKFAISILDDNSAGIMDCADCFIRNNCK